MTTPRPLTAHPQHSRVHSVMSTPRGASSRASVRAFPSPSPTRGFRAQMAPPVPSPLSSNAVRASNSWEAWGPSAGADSALNASTCSIASVASVARHAKTPSGGSNTGPDRIHVYVRPRPMHTNASADGLPGEQVSIYADTEARTINITADSTSKTIPCDGAFDRSATQAEVYAAVGTRFVAPLLEGWSGCIFAYGQTGSGKTFCINGGSGEGDAGIIPRMLDDVFRAASEHAANGGAKREFFVESLEIYDDKLYDLLAAATAAGASSSTVAPPPRGLIISEGSSKRVIVQGLQKIPVRSSAEAKALLALAQSARSTSATAMNAQSSRSHSIFTLVCESDSASGTGRQISKLNVVDLAGSESQKQGVTEGQTRKEGNKINMSLSALSLVIQEIQEGRQPAYRSSKLTHILRDSLCGSALTTLIATINPSVRHLATTLSTLQFAERAQSVRIDATKALAVPAMDPREMRLKFAQLQRENTELKQKISSAAQRGAQTIIPAAACMDIAPQQMALLMQLMERESSFLEQCMAASDSNETLLNEARNQYTEVEAERDALAREVAELKRSQTLPLNGTSGFKSPVRANYATMPSSAVASSAGEWLPRTEVDALLLEVRRKASELASIEFHAMNERSAGEHMEAIHAERDRRKALQIELDGAKAEIARLQSRLIELDGVAEGSALAEKELLGDLEATEEKLSSLQAEHAEAIQSHHSAMQDADEQIARLARENSELKLTVESLQAQLAPPSRVSVQLQQQQLIHFPLSFKIQQQQQRAKTPLMQPQRAPLDTPSMPTAQPQTSHALQPSALLNSPLSPILGKGTPTRLSVLFSGEKASRASAGGGSGEAKIASPHLGLDENAAPIAAPVLFTPKQQMPTHRLSMSPAFYIGHTAPSAAAAATKQVSPRHTRSHTASTHLRA